MAKKYPGIDSRTDRSIEIGFNYLGKWRRETEYLPPTLANLKHAYNKKLTIEKQIKQGTFDYAEWFPNSKNAQLLSTKKQIPTITSELRNYLTLTKSDLKESTWLKYQRDINNVLIPEFGHLTLDELNRQIVKLWINKTTFSQKRLNNLLSPLKSIYNDALADGRTNHNPFFGWNPTVPRKNRKGKPPIEIFKPDELTKILNVSTPQIRNLILFLASTGLRTGEWMALRWENVDLKNKRLTINENVVDGHIDTPKTDAGDRVIDMIDSACTALKEQAEYTRFKKGRVFLTPKGEAYNSDGQFRDHLWIKLLEKAEVRYRKPYCLRHTFASIQITRGANLKWIATQMGHATTEILERNYAEWIYEAQDNEGAKSAKVYAGIIGGLK